MQNRMRICFVAFSFFPRVGGAEVRVDKEARQLQALGHDVTIVTLRHERSWKSIECLHGLPVIRVRGLYKRGGKLRAGRLGHLPVDITMFLALWHLRHTYDLIFVCQVSPLAAVAALIAKLTKKPVVISIQAAGSSSVDNFQHGQGITLMKDTLTALNLPKIHPKNLITDDLGYLTRSALGGRILVHYLRQSNAFYRILSKRSYSHLISRGFRADRIVYISGSVDTEKFFPVPKYRLNAQDQARDLICVSRLDYSKGIDVLLHAWGRMMNGPSEWREHLRPRLLLVGVGPFKSQLELIVAGLGIQNSVEFLGLRRDIIELLQRAWGFVLPSRLEGMPNALLEAMACGLPCVATKVSGSEDVISDGVNGLLVEPEQPAEMAQALKRIIGDSELAQQLGREGRKTVVHSYQLSPIVDQCVDFYRSLLNMDQNSIDQVEKPPATSLHAISLALEGEQER